MVLDWTVTLGTLIELVSLMGGGLFFLTKVSSTFKLLIYRLDHLEETIKAHTGRLDGINEAMVTLARQEERLNSISKRIESLRS